MSPVHSILILRAAERSDLREPDSSNIFAAVGVSTVHRCKHKQCIVVGKHLSDLASTPRRTPGGQCRDRNDFEVPIPLRVVQTIDDALLISDTEACKAGAGTPCLTRCPNRDSVRHHVSRSGFGGTCAILCRSSMPGPGASLGILASMRDSMRDPASSHGLWDSVRTARQDPGPNPGPRAPAGSECGTTYLDRDSDAHAAYYAGVPCRDPVPRSGS